MPPGFIRLRELGASLNELARPPTGPRRGTGKDTQESTGGQQLVNRQTALDFLKGQGVPFSPARARTSCRRAAADRAEHGGKSRAGRCAGRAGERLRARSRSRSKRSSSRSPRTISRNSASIGYSGQFNIPGSAPVFGGGGTSGTGHRQPSDYPFARRAAIRWAIPGHRRQSQRQPRDHRERDRRAPLRRRRAPAVAPGIFGLSGVFTDPQFQVVIRALNQKKGVDLLSAPRVTTKSGQRAVIEIVREFRYPTQFDPPKIPQTDRAALDDAASRASVRSAARRLVPVTPTTPTGFETRNTGVTLEVEPVVGPDGVTIDLNLVPQVVEFEGFINYGSPILAPRLRERARRTHSRPNVITPNVINQPIFNSRKVTTSVSVWDGQTVVLGGLMREDVQKTEDRTPIIGDIPLVGRLFRDERRAAPEAQSRHLRDRAAGQPGGQPINTRRRRRADHLHSSRRCCRRYRFTRSNWI